MYWNRLNLDSSSQDTYHLPINFGTSLTHQNKQNWALTSHDPHICTNKTQLQKVDMNLMQNLRITFRAFQSVCNPLILAILELPGCAGMQYSVPWLSKALRLLEWHCRVDHWPSPMDVSGRRQVWMSLTWGMNKLKTKKPWMEMETIPKMSVDTCTFWGYLTIWKDP